MQVNSGMSENVESFSNFQHGREICFHQNSSHKRGSAENLRDPDQKHLYSACCFLYCCGKKKKKQIAKPSLSTARIKQTWQIFV